MYTLLQVFGLGVLWAVKSSSIALVFPFFVLAMVPLRMSLRFIFTPLELEAVSTFALKNVSRSAFVPTWRKAQLRNRIEALGQSLLFCVFRVEMSYFSFSWMAKTLARLSGMKSLIFTSKEASEVNVNEFYDDDDIATTTTFNEYFYCIKQCLGNPNKYFWFFNQSNNHAKYMIPFIKTMILECLKIKPSQSGARLHSRLEHCYSLLQYWPLHLQLQYGILQSLDLVQNLLKLHSQPWSVIKNFKVCPKKDRTLHFCSNAQGNWD